MLKLVISLFLICIAFYYLFLYNNNSIKQDNILDEPIIIDSINFEGMCSSKKVRFLKDNQVKIYDPDSIVPEDNEPRKKYGEPRMPLKSSMKSENIMMNEKIDVRDFENANCTGIDEFIGDKPKICNVIDDDYSCRRADNTNLGAPVYYDRMVDVSKRGYQI